MPDMQSLEKAELVATTRCYGNCGTCYGGGDFGPAGEHVDTDVLLSRAGKLAAYAEKGLLDHMALIGGEPLTHPGLPQLVSEYTGRIPITICTAGEPPGGVDVEPFIGEVEWNLTYHPQIGDAYKSLAGKLLRSGKSFITALNFLDHKSLIALCEEFGSVLPSIGMPAGDEFAQYVRGSVNETNYFQWALAKKLKIERPGVPVMAVYLNPIDLRFTRHGPDHFTVPYTDSPPARCWLVGAKEMNIAVREDGSVVPCAAPAQRHVPPIIRSIDLIDEIPGNLSEAIRTCGNRILMAKRTIKEYRGRRDKDDVCDMACSKVDWAVA